jgi:hypothetical protein
MEAIARFFDSINNYLGVSSPSELMIHPYFIGLCVALFLYALISGMKYMAVVIGGVIGTSVIVHYLYPADTSQLGDLLWFVLALGGMGLVLLYFAFIRE